jgi:putative heme-binding domain-containing protein
MSRCLGRVSGLVLLGLVLAATPAIGQHEATIDEVKDGERLFMSNCATCHGADGDAVFSVDLGHGQFRQASTDADLIRIIRSGIAGTSMPPGNYSEAQAGTIVAYLRSLASTSNAAVPGDAARGRLLFEGKGACLTCHRVSGSGSRLAPELSDIGQFRRADELTRSLVDPSAEIKPPNRSFRVVTRERATITGRLLNQDTFTVQLMDDKEQLRSFQKSALREYGFVDESPMPSYRNKLTADELTDLVKYLVSLKILQPKP